MRTLGAGNLVFAAFTAMVLLIIGVFLAGSLLPLGVAPLKPMQIADQAMAPTLFRGTLVVARPAPAQPARGDLVAYSPREGAVFPGRVVGLPGESVSIQAGRLLLNGRAADEPYVREAMTYELDALVLAGEEYFILGDNRNESNDDSHISGPISRGKIVAALWVPGGAPA